MANAAWLGHQSKNPALHTPSNAREEGRAWGDMAVLCFDTKTRDLYSKTT